MFGTWNLSIDLDILIYTHSVDEVSNSLVRVYFFTPAYRDRIGLQTLESGKAFLCSVYCTEAEGRHTSIKLRLILSVGVCIWYLLAIAFDYRDLVETRGVQVLIVNANEGILITYYFEEIRMTSLQFITSPQY